jgi:hypothetical protein
MANLAASRGMAFAEGQQMAPRTAFLGKSVQRRAVSGVRQMGRSAALGVEAIAAPPKYQRPDVNGRYGVYGGKYVPETLIPALEELELEYNKARADPAFKVGSKVAKFSIYSLHCDDKGLRIIAG